MSAISQQIDQHLQRGASASMMLNASCQAIIESYIEPSASPWYPPIERALADIQVLVRQWRQSGFLYFDRDIVEETASTDQYIMQQRDSILNAFAQLSEQVDPELKAQLIKNLQGIEEKVGGTASHVSSYNTFLTDWNGKMLSAQGQLNDLIKRVQTEEAELEATIQAINVSIQELYKEIKETRNAINEAKAAEKRGTAETIIGLALAPFTGGASLILAGIGVYTLNEAEDQLKQLQGTLHSYQDKLNGDVRSLDADQKKVSLLKSLDMVVCVVLDDINDLFTYLDKLRTAWLTFEKEFQFEIKKLEDAQSASDFVIGKAWFHSMLNEWKIIMDTVNLLKSLKSE